MYYSTLQSSSTTFIPLQEAVTTLPNNNNNINPIRPDISMWLGQDDLFSPFSGAPSFESIYYNNDPSIDQWTDYKDYLSCNYDQFVENFVGVDYYQMCDKIDNVGDMYNNTYQNNNNNSNNNVSSNIYNNARSHAQTWGFEGLENKSNGNNKVGRYSVEERRDRILRYIKKRNQRNFRKTIKYACRKTLADRRVRVRGRFAKNQDEEFHSNGDDRTILPYFDYSNKNEEYCEEAWLQEAIEALMK